MREHQIIFLNISSLVHKFAPRILNIYQEICATHSDVLQRICHLCKKSCPALMQNSVYTCRATARDSKQHDFTR